MKDRTSFKIWLHFHMLRISFAEFALAAHAAAMSFGEFNKAYKELEKLK